MRTAAAVSARQGGLSPHRLGRAMLTTIAVAAALATSAAGAGDAHADFGLVPGSSILKAHDPCPLTLGLGFQVADRPCLVAATPVSQAGAHPDATGAGDLQDFQLIPTRNFAVDTPPGFLGDPTVVPVCDRETFRNTWDEGANPAEGCSPASQVGVATVDTAGIALPTASAVYRLTAAPGYPASFGFKVAGFGILVNANVRTDGDYGLTVTGTDIAAGLGALQSATVTLWGDPANPIHDPDRWNPAKPGFGTPEAPKGDWGASSGLPRAPFIQTPADCGNGSLVSVARIDSWTAPGQFLPDILPPGDPRRDDYEIPAPQPTGCDKLSFKPTITLTPSARKASSPSGLTVDLRVPQNHDPDGLSTPPLKKTVVTLPEGLVVNPSAADGLEGCSEEQMGLLTTTGDYPNPIRFAKGDADCPGASKLGTGVIHTPVLDDPVEGDVYLASPYDNPFDSLLALYLVFRGPGFVVKVPGQVDTDADSGRLTATFDNNPQLPFESLELSFPGGPRASLTTPSTCGTHSSTALLTSWAGHARDVSHPFTVDCPGDPGGFDPAFDAGSTHPFAGSFSRFVARVTRDGGSELGRIDVTLPKGALASLKDVGVCSETQIASSTNKAGVVTQDAPSCPLASQIGTTTVGAGAGSLPFFPRIPGTDHTGRVFLSAPHTNTEFPVAGMRQAAYGLAIEAPAVGGPFDLGTVMVRAAIYVHPRTGQVTVVSDRLPRTLQGIVLNVRDVRVNIDRKDFTLNPSSCEEKQVVGDIHAQDGTGVSRSTRFQVGDCAALPFRPEIAMRLTGRKQTRTGRHPGVKATVTQTGVGEAGIEKAVVRLPKSLALDPDNAQALCEFEAGAKPDLESHCPAGSIVGRARAVSPLLKNPLAGNVYFVKNVRRDPRTGNLIRTLPMIVVALRGEVAINLYGKSSTTRAGKLVNTFDEVPDAPIGQFNLSIRGGDNGILAVTRTRRALIDLCAGRHIAEADIDGHNGRRHDFDIRMKTPCTRKQTRAAKRQAKRAAAKARKAKS